MNALLQADEEIRMKDPSLERLWTGPNELRSYLMRDMPEWAGAEAQPVYDGKDGGEDEPDTKPLPSEIPAPHSSAPDAPHQAPPPADPVLPQPDA